MIDRDAILVSVRNMLHEAEQHINAGNYFEAVASAERAISVARFNDHTASLAAAYYGMAAVIWGSGGSSEEAHRYASLAAQHSSANSTTDLLVRTLVARIKAARGNFSAAIALNEDLLDYYTETHKPEGQADILRSLGDVHKQKGEFNRAQERYLQSLALFQRLDDPLNHAGLLLSLGSLMFQMQSFEEARAYWQQARNIAEANGFRHVVEAADKGLALL